MNPPDNNQKDNYPSYSGTNPNYGGIRYYDRRIYVNETDYFLPSVTLQVHIPPPLLPLYKLVLDQYSWGACKSNGRSLTRGYFGFTAASFSLPPVSFVTQTVSCEVAPSHCINQKLFIINRMTAVCATTRILQIMKVWLVYAPLVIFQLLVLRCTGDSYRKSTWTGKVPLVLIKIALTWLLNFFLCFALLKPKWGLFWPVWRYSQQDESNGGELHFNYFLLNLLSYKSYTVQFLTLLTLKNTSRLHLQSGDDWYSSNVKWRRLVFFCSFTCFIFLKASLLHCQVRP